MRVQAAAYWSPSPEPLRARPAHLQSVANGGSVAGILDQTIEYADAAGGMTQGLLLYYMVVTAKVPKEALYALDYLRNRVQNLRKARKGTIERIVALSGGPICPWRPVV